MNVLKHAIGVPLLAAALAYSGTASAAHGGHGGAHMAHAHTFGGHGHGHGHGGFRGAFFAGGVFFAGGPGYWSYYDTWPFYDDYLALPESVAPAYIEQGGMLEQPNANWYYCNSPPGYYPYVQNCPSGWQRVQPNLPPGMY